MRLVHQTELGRLYQGDCIEFLQSLEAQSVHTFFADPPFNLGKHYGSKGKNLVRGKKPDQQTENGDAEFLETQFGSNEDNG